MRKKKHTAKERLIVQRGKHIKKGKNKSSEALALLVYLPFCCPGLSLSSYIYSEYRFHSEGMRQKLSQNFLGKLFREYQYRDWNIIFFLLGLEQISLFHWVPDEVSVVLLKEILCEKKICFFKLWITQDFTWCCHHERKWPKKQKMPIFQFRLTPGNMFFKCNCDKNAPHILSVLFLSLLRKASEMQFAWVNCICLKMCPGLSYLCMIGSLK